jgi:hypothetical protein
LAVCLEHPPDYVAGVEAAHVVDDPAGLAGLEVQQAFGQAAQVEPHGNRQAEEPEKDRRHQQGSDRALLPRGLIGQSRHVRLEAPPPRSNARTLAEFDPARPQFFLTADRGLGQELSAPDGQPRWQ